MYYLLFNASLSCILDGIYVKSSRRAEALAYLLLPALLVASFIDGIGSWQKRRLRACIHRLYTESIGNDERLRLERHLLGWLGHLRVVDPDAHAALCAYRERLIAKREVAASTIHDDIDET